MELTTQEQPNGLDKFISFKKSTDEFALECAQLKVTDDVTEALATQVVSKAMNIEKAIDKKRKELKAPYLEAGREIDGAANYLVEELKSSIAIARKEILKYKEEQENIRLAEMHRINQLKIKLAATQKHIKECIDNAKTVDELKEVWKNDIKTFPGAEVWQDINLEAIEVIAQMTAYGSAKKKLLTNPEQAQEIVEAQIQITKQAEAVIVSSGEEKLLEIDTAKKSGLRDNWKFELLDITKVPAFLLQIDEKKVDKFMKEGREAGMIVNGTEMHGIRFFIEKSLVVKS